MSISAPLSGTGVAPSPDKASSIPSNPKRPKWIDPKTPFQIKRGYAVALGHTVTPPGAGVEEGYIIAANVAREGICRAMEYRVDLIFQDSEEGTSVDHAQIKEINMELCKVTAGATQPGRRYWEKVMTSASNGDRVVVYRVFVNEVIEEEQLKKLVVATVRKQERKGTIPSHYSKRFKTDWERFAKGE